MQSPAARYVHSLRSFAQREDSCDLGPGSRKRRRRSRLCYHFDVSITDTAPSAQAVQWQVHRAMTGEQRLLMALEMSVFVRELQKARIRQEHPQWPDTEVVRELFRSAFPPGLEPALLR